LHLEGVKVLVVGMARSGLAAVSLLLEHGAIVRATDKKTKDALGETGQQLDTLQVPFAPESETDFGSFDLIVLSPGVPSDVEPFQQARARGVRIIGEVELAGAFLKGRIIGITGSNGKTTTTALVGHILTDAGIAAQVGGNIGTPPTSMVAASRDDRWNVLELSSFQLETIDRFRVHVAVILNVTPNHLNRHHTMEAYSAAKARILENQQGRDFAVLNAADPVCVALARQVKGQVVWFSGKSKVSPGAYLERGRLFFNGDPILHARDIPLPGAHNVENVLAASAAARLVGASLPQIAAAVRTFTAVEHRLEFVTEIAGVRYFNDSKATSVDATMKALEALAGPLWVILGGQDKGSDYTVLRPLLEAKAKAALLIGEAAGKIESHLAGSVALVPAGTLETAVRRARESAAAGDTVLLAPACASYDQFENFEQRGRAFKEIVASLAKEG
jgi:UDP-N-acetylmuramoylalanine--D-glutamate ligase